MLALLNEKLKTLHKENTDLELKLRKAETQSLLDNQTVQALEHSLLLTKATLNNFNEKQIADIAAQNLKDKICNDSFTKELNILKMNLEAKNQEFQLCEQEKNKMIITYNDKLSALEEQLMSEKQKCKEKRYLHNYINFNKIIFILIQNKNSNAIFENR